MPKPDDLDQLRTRAGEVAKLLKTLSHPARLLIACDLMDGETSVSGIEERTGVRQPSLSRDLARLRTAGLVKTRRQSKMIYYSLQDDRLERLVDALCNAFGEPEPKPRKRKRARPAQKQGARRKSKRKRP